MIPPGWPPHTTPPLLAFTTLMSLGKAPPPHGAELGDTVDTGRPGVLGGGGRSSLFCPGRLAR